MSTGTGRSPPPDLQAPNENHNRWLLRRIWDRVNHDNEHFMGCVVGREGSGKSYTAIKIAHMIDPTFNADRVIFEIGELLRILREGEHEPGNFYVLDEAGVQLGNRTWYDRGQILANQALQLIRKHNLGLLFTIPVLGDLDSQAQNRLQAYLELTKKEPGEYVSGRWLWVNPDRTDRTGKRYDKYPRRRRNGYKVRVNAVRFTPPPEEIVEPYEERKDEFLDEFYAETIEELSDEDDEEEERTPKDVAEQVIGNPDPYVSIHNSNGIPYVDKSLLQADLGLSINESEQVKKLVEREIDLDAYREG